MRYRQDQDVGPPAGGIDSVDLENASHDRGSRSDLEPGGRGPRCPMRRVCVVAIEEWRKSMEKKGAMEVREVREVISHDG